jgi:hypothetical protein
VDNFDSIPRIYSGEPTSSPERCEDRYKILAKYAPSDGVFAELGVFKGDFVHFLLRMKPSKLFLVDPWYLLSNSWHFSFSEKTENCTVEALLNLLATYKEEIKNRVLFPVVGTSQTFLNSIEDNTLDFCYIDTTHQYDQTVWELEMLHHKVKHNGIICGDDYCKRPDSGGYQVYNAIKSQLKTGNFDLLVDGESNQFVLRNKKTRIFP